MSGLTSVHSRPAAAALSTSGWRSSIVFVAKRWRELFREFLSSYRPELHYMRGPGPRWREKHGAVLAHDGGIQVSAQELRTDLTISLPGHEERGGCCRGRGTDQPPRHPAGRGGDDPLIGSRSAPRVGDAGPCLRLIRAEAEGIFPDVGHATEMNRRAAAQCPERRAIARRTSRETQTLAAVDLEHGHTQAREIVEARRVLIARLEQRRRLPVGLGHELSEVA
jgi:hypothetical protein